MTSPYGGRDGPSASGSGTGLVGMRERTALLHGSFEAGPQGSADGKIWAVRVTLPVTTGSTTDPPSTGDKVKLGYFTEWGVYGRNYHVKNLETSGSAAKLTHIIYAFGNVKDGRCAVGDAWADYDKAYAADRVRGRRRRHRDQPLRGNFNQLRKLKAKHPDLKVLWSFGGWTCSGGFTQAAPEPGCVRRLLHVLVEDPRWADVFDGIDIDWEYPNACGLTCDTSGPAAFRNLMGALRAEFGSNGLVTAAITADGISAASSTRPTTAAPRNTSTGTTR